MFYTRNYTGLIYCYLINSYLRPDLLVGDASFELATPAV